MSWRGWTDSCLRTSQGHNACTYAWICDMNGNPWGYSHMSGSHDDQERPQWTPAEFDKIMRVLTGTASADEKASGIDLAGVHYFLIQQADNDFITCKKKNNGFTIAKAKTCLLVGMYEQGEQPGNNNLQVCKTRDRLVEQGY